MTWIKAHPIWTLVIVLVVIVGVFIYLTTP